MRTYNLNEQQHCDICNIPLSGSFKFTGSVFMCNRCYKVRLIIRILLILASVILYFLFALLSFRIGLSLGAGVVFYPSIIILVILALILTNPVTKWYIKNHPKNQK